MFIDLKTWCGEKKHSRVFVVFPFLFLIMLFCLIDLIIISSEILLWFFFLCSWSACGYACICVKAAHGCVHMWKIEHSLRWPLCFSPRVAAWSSLSRPGRPVDLGSARLCSQHLATVCATAQGLNQLLMCAWQVLSWLFSHASLHRSFYCSFLCCLVGYILLWSEILKNNL